MTGCCDEHCRTWEADRVYPERHCTKCPIYWADWEKP